MKTLFMGTPDFALDTLKYLYENTELLAVFTKVDKVNGRGNKITFSPVKQFALDNCIDIIQPKSLRVDETYNLIKEYNPDPKNESRIDYLRDGSISNPIHPNQFMRILSN